MIFKAGNYYRHNETTHVIFVDTVDIPVMGKRVMIVNEYEQVDLMTPERASKPESNWKEVDSDTWQNAVKRARRAMKRYEHIYTYDSQNVKVFKFEDMPKTVKKAFNRAMPDTEPDEIVDWQFCDGVDSNSEQVDAWLSKNGASGDESMVRIQY